MKANVHVSQIRDKIIAHLQRANNAIKIAVAWFTDEDIVRVLSQRKEAGIDIEIVISNAKENFVNPDTFKDYLRQKGKLFVSTGGKFLHHKFCIIDNHTILNGSYNWSHAAARWNEENILVITLESGDKEDDDLLKRFEVKHKYLREKCSVAVSDLDSLRAFRTNAKDFAAIQSTLDEQEIILRQQFENDVRRADEKSRAAGIPTSPGFFERMVRDGGGVEFVKRILHDEMTSGDMKSGFRKLEEHIPHLVNLSLEYLASRPKYETLFTRDEVHFCKTLMAKYNL